MKPGPCRLVGNRSVRGACPGQLYVLAGLSQVCGSETFCFRGQDGTQGRRRSGVGAQSLF